MREVWEALLYGDERHRPLVLTAPSSGSPVSLSSFGVHPAIPIVTGIVCPDHARAVLAPSHRTSSAHHSTGIKAQELLNSLTAHVIDMRGRGDKAINGNCWSESNLASLSRSTS